MEAMAIQLGIGVAMNGAKIIYDNRNEIKNFISKHKYKMDEEFIDDPIDEIPDLKLEDEYKSDISNDETDKKINKNIKKFANKIIDEHPITIPQNTKSSGFNPISKLMDVVKRNITPDREKARQNTPVKQSIPDPLKELIENIIKFLIFEISSQHIDGSDLQTYQDYTKKLIFSIRERSYTGDTQNKEKRIKIKSK